MDWIERLTGWDPDGGSGALEMLIMAVPVLVVTVFVIRTYARIAIWSRPRRRDA